jgi:signal transduction histidine kinase/ActR/RegA family two-component response regulator
MQFRSLNSIKNKLTGVIMLTSFIALMTASIAFAIYEFSKFRTTMVKEMSSMALMIGFNSTAPLEFNDSNEGKEVLEAFRADPRIILAETFNSEGKVFAFYQTPDLKDRPIPQKPKADGDYFEDGYLSIYKPIIHKEDRIGTIHILMDSRELEKRFKEYGMIVFGVVLFSSIVAFLFSSFIQKTISKPVLHLAETAERVSSEKDYSIRAEKNSNDEVGILIKRFNQMLSQIQERDIALKSAHNNLEDRVKERTKELNLAKEEAEKSNQAKSDFLSRMSHELRTPLNAILGFGQLLNIDENEPLIESQKDKVDEILTAGNHLLELINELLDLARVESGKLTLSLDEVNFLEVINEVISIITPLANQRNIQIISPEQKYMDFTIIADRIRFKQVMLNLMGNAVKFNRENGSIILEIEDVKEDRVVIHIADTGRGMSKDKLDSLFESFNRLDADDTGVEGTGIGLNITKNLVELMDGAITVQSVPDEGSRFSVELTKRDNLKSSEEKLVITPSKKIPHAGGDNKYTILYVEDNPANLALVKQILSVRSEFSLLTAYEAQLGIDLANFQQPDLILMDINLPGMDGVTAMKHLRANKRTSKIPIIAMSANAMQPQIDKALLAGFDSYITKPIRVDYFLETINHHLNINYTSTGEDK